MIKNYILDTNVPLHDPQPLLSFSRESDRQLAIPIEAIEEVDRFKRESSGRRQYARRTPLASHCVRVANGSPLAANGKSRGTPKPEGGYALIAI